MYKFIISSTNKENMLTGHRKEVCFIGRSNVGKSSLINAIVGQSSLARTSNTPGRTQLINFFQDDKKTLVDLPGYGFAKMPFKIKKRMFKMIEEYFETRVQLVKTFLLMDSKIGPTKDDIQMVEYVKSLDRDFIIILTKSDKSKQSEIAKSVKIASGLSNDVILVSSKKGTNIFKLKKVIDSIFNQKF